MQPKRFLVSGLAIGALLIGANGCGGSSGGKDRTITLQAVPRSPGEVVNFVDQPPKSPSGQPDHITAGDQIQEVGTVLDGAGHAAGTRYSILTFLTPSTHEQSVNYSESVFYLSHGAIYSAGVHGLAAGGSDAVTGGTGDYAAARGTVTEADSKSGHQIFTIHLLD